MKSIWVFLFSVVLAGLTVAQTADDLALLQKVRAAEASAPASRMTSTITDRASGATVETIVIEHVPPSAVHFVTTHNGQPGSEMISDGTRTLRRTGPNEPWKSTPMNLSALLKNHLSEDKFRKQHGHLKLIGDDQVDGMAAKVYQLTEDIGPSKIWIAADTSRMLKIEGDFDGSIPGPNPMKKDANGKMDLKALTAQFKAATEEHHLHVVTNYHYDPSLKITMPPN